MIRGVAVSEAGRVRRTNEDYAICDESLQLFAVADGMGGHAAGDVAARLASETLAGFIRRSRQAADAGFEWPFGFDPSRSLPANRLRTAIRLANRRVLEAARQDASCEGMGTTVVAVLATETGVVVGHVGDSRSYLWDRGRLVRLTRDDSWAEHAGPAAVGHAGTLQHVLTSALGVHDEPPIHLLERGLRGGERFLLCTDGLHAAVDDLTVEQLMGATTDLRLTARALVDTALDQGSRDNVTVVILENGS